MSWPQQETRIELALPSPTKIFTPGVTALLILMVLGYAVLSHAPDFTIKHLALHPQALLSGCVWQLLTYSLVNGGCGLGFALVTVLFIGSAIEREWRTRSFLTLWIVVSMVCALVWSLISLVVGRDLIGVGSAPCLYGLIGAFGLVFRRKRFWMVLWTVEAQVLALILIGIGLVLGIARPIMWIWVAGAGVAYLYIKLRWRVAQGIPRLTRKRGSFVDID